MTQPRQCIPLVLLLDIVCRGQQRAGSAGTVGPVFILHEMR